MHEHPPEPPPLSVEVVDSLVDWLDKYAAWLRVDHDRARAHGHGISPEALATLRLHEGAALLLRESYGLPTDPG
jgi:hypothetical protein